jgi:hypothetical protein
MSELENPTEQLPPEAPAQPVPPPSDWDDLDANVVCRYRGFEGNVRAAYITGTRSALAVHGMPVGRGRWMVTHVPSGFAVVADCATRQVAEEIGSWLWLQVIDHAAFGGPDMPAALASVPPRAREIMAGYAPAERKPKKAKRWHQPMDWRHNTEAQAHALMAKYAKLYDECRVQAAASQRIRESLDEEIKQFKEREQVLRDSETVHACAQADLASLRERIVAAIGTLDHTGRLAGAQSLRGLRAVSTPTEE